MHDVLSACLIAASIFTGSPQVTGDTLTVDRVVEQYVAAIGGMDNIKVVQNLVYRGGLYTEGEYRGEGDAAMSRARPYFKLVGDKNDPGGYMEGYDGSAWEWFADPGVVIRTVGAASGAIRHYAGVESPLVDYAAKGSTAAILGETALQDRPVVVIELTRRDGFLEQLYLDTESWLLVASGGAAPIHAFGEDVTTLTLISDYRPVAGVQIAHRFVSFEVPTNRELSSMQWATIEANVDLPGDWFSPPEFERTPLQRFIEQLYGQRSDVEAMMWTYDEFRLAHPDTPTSDAVNVAGYQILKMGDVEQAVALLGRNVEDNPGSADARFGLGRALRSAGRVEKARLEFELALVIDPEHSRSIAALAAMD